jgi:Ca2+-binding EF-hand superfamily protein
MDFGAFLGIFGFHGDSNSESNLQQIFEEFDKDGKGIFGAIEFEKVAASVGEHFSQA